jgi:hypothetical protein
VVVTGPSGYRVALTRRPDGTYLAPLGFDGMLLRTAPGWTLQRRSRGDAFDFSRDGSLEATRDAGGRRYAVEYVDVRDRTLLSSYGSGSGQRAGSAFAVTGFCAASMTRRPRATATATRPAVLRPGAAKRARTRSTTVRARALKRRRTIRSDAQAHHTSGATAPAAVAIRAAFGA